MAVNPNIEKIRRPKVLEQLQRALNVHRVPDELDISQPVQAAVLLPQLWYSGLRWYEGTKSTLSTTGEYLVVESDISDFTQYIVGIYLYKSQLQAGSFWEFRLYGEPENVTGAREFKLFREDITGTGEVFSNQSPVSGYALGMIVPRGLRARVVVRLISNGTTQASATVRMAIVEQY